VGIGGGVVYKVPYVCTAATRSRLPLQTYTRTHTHTHAHTLVSGFRQYSTLNSHSEWRDWKVPEVRCVCVRVRARVCLSICLCLCGCTCDSQWCANNPRRITTALHARDARFHLATDHLATSSSALHVYMVTHFSFRFTDPFSGGNLSPGLDLAQLRWLHRVASCRSDQLHRLLEPLAAQGLMGQELPVAVCLHGKRSWAEQRNVQRKGGGGRHGAMEK